MKLLQRPQQCFVLGSVCANTAFTLHLLSASPTVRCLGTPLSP